MSKKYWHNDKLFNQRLLDYLNGKLSEEEKYAFEKQINQDEFDLEALEGLEEYNTGDIQEDIHNIQERLNQKTNRKVIPLYRRIGTIAATIGILMVGFGTWYLVTQDKTAQQLADAPEVEAPVYEEAPAEEESLQMDTGETENIITKKEPAADAEKGIEKDTKPAEDVTTEKPAETKKTEDEGRYDFVIAEEMENTAMADIHPDPEQEEVAVPQIRPAENTRKTEQIAKEDTTQPVIMIRGLASAVTKKQIQDELTVSGRIFTKGTDEAIPGASVFIQGTEIGTVSDLDGNFTLNIPPEHQGETLQVAFIGYITEEFPVVDQEIEIEMEPSLVALEEVVVTGVTRQKAVHNTGSVSKIELDKEYENNNRRAHPEGGYIAFNKYLKDNIRLPEAHGSDDTFIVKLTLSINARGKITHIEIWESPGKAYTEEAKRLIMNGPAWNARLVGGERVESEVKLKIKFKE
ncbi:MAG: carboxypeptidase-like regulatory domain-containing protein [Bacteroidota bacterium]